MGILEILWIYLILTTIQPVITQKWLEASRLRLLRKLERSRGSRVIALVHRQETMSLLGFPILRYINIFYTEEAPTAIYPLAKPDALPIFADSRPRSPV